MQGMEKGEESSFDHYVYIGSSKGKEDDVNCLYTAACCLIRVTSELQTIQRTVIEQQDDTIDQLSSKVRQLTSANRHLVDYLDLLKERNERVGELTLIKESKHEKELDKATKLFTKVMYGKDERNKASERKVEKFRSENQRLYVSNNCLRRTNKELKTENDDLRAELMRTQYLLLQIYFTLQSNPAVREVLPYIYAGLFQSPVHTLSLESNMQRLNKMLSTKGPNRFVGNLNRDISQTVPKLQELIGSLYY